MKCIPKRNSIFTLFLYFCVLVSQSLLSQVASNFPGSSTYATLHEAVTNAVSGTTTIYILPGTHTISSPVILTNKKNITITSKSWVTSGDNTSTVINGNGTNAFVFNGRVTNVMLRGFTISNAVSAVLLNAGTIVNNNNKIHNMELHHNTKGTGYGSTARDKDINWSLASNRIFQNISHGLDITGVVNIFSNRIHNNGGSGINNTSEINPALIYRNNIYSNTTTGINISLTFTAGAKIYSNRIWRNLEEGIKITTSATRPISVWRNLLYNNRNGVLVERTPNGGYLEVFTHNTIINSNGFAFKANATSSISRNVLNNIFYTTGTGTNLIISSGNANNYTFAYNSFYGGTLTNSGITGSYTWGANNILTDPLLNVTTDPGKLLSHLSPLVNTATNYSPYSTGHIWGGPDIGWDETPLASNITYPFSVAITGAGATGSHYRLSKSGFVTNVTNSAAITNNFTLTGGVYTIANTDGKIYTPSLPRTFTLNSATSGTNLSFVASTILAAASNSSGQYFSNIQSAINGSGNGTNVFIFPGTHTLNSPIIITNKKNMIITASSWVASQNNTLTVINGNSANAFLFNGRATNVMLRGFTVSNSLSAILFNAGTLVNNNNKVHNMKLHNNQNGFGYGTTSRTYELSWSIASNHIYNNSLHGAHLSGTTMSIFSNRIHNNALSGIYNANEIDDARIYRNNIYSNSTTGIHISTTFTAGGKIYSNRIWRNLEEGIKITTSATRPISVWRNLLYNNRNGVLVERTPNGGYLEIFTHNTIINSNGFAFKANATSSISRNVLNNIFYTTGTGTNLIISSGNANNYTFAYNSFYGGTLINSNPGTHTWGASNITDNPLINVTTDPGRILKGHSPLIDSATNYAPYSTGFKLIGPDIGWDETDLADTERFQVTLAFSGTVTNSSYHIAHKKTNIYATNYLPGSVTYNLPYGRHTLNSTAKFFVPNTPITFFMDPATAGTNMAFTILDTEPVKMSGRLIVEEGLTGNIVLFNNGFSNSITIKGKTNYTFFGSQTNYTLYYSGDYKSEPDKYQLNNLKSSVSGYDFVISSFSVYGSVIDTENNFVSDVDIDLISADGSIKKRTQSANDGSFQIPQLKKGEYTLGAVLYSKEYIFKEDTIVIKDRSITNKEIILSNKKEIPDFYSPRILQDPSVNGIPFRLVHNGKIPFDVEYSIYSSDGRLKLKNLYFNNTRHVNYLTVQPEIIKEMPLGTYIMIVKINDGTEELSLKRMIILQ